MSVTYNSGDLTGNTISAVRFLVGDKVEARALLDDAEITYLLGVYGSTAGAVIPACDAMIAAQSQIVDWSSGSEHETAAQRLAALEAMRDRLLSLGYPAPTGTAPQVRQLVRLERDGTQTEYEAGGGL